MYKIDQLTEIDLGVVQENEATEIQIDVNPWLKKWPDGIFAVNVCRPGEMEPYPANCRVEDGMLYWLVTEGELAIAGNGRCDIRLYQGAVKKKTRIAITRIHETLPGSTQDAPPDAAQGWLDSLNETRAEVESNTKAAKESAAQAAASEEQAQGHAQSASESANAAETAKQHAEQAAESAQQHAESAAQDAQFLSQRSAVWIGEEAPPEPGYDLWVNPEGRETELPGGTYELPTASADVKGGVKVGNGLQMDGDMLGVKDMPELIATIEINENTEWVIIDKDINGNGFNLKSATVLITRPDGYAKHQNFVGVKKYRWVSYSSSNYMRKYQRVSIVPVGAGLWTGYTAWSDILIMNNVSTHTVQYCDSESNMIDRIVAYEQDSVEAGSIIKIYGVRA